MAMVYQEGFVYEKGTRIKKWYGQFRVYERDQQGKEVRKNKKVVLGLKSQLRRALLNCFRPRFSCREQPNKNTTRRLKPNPSRLKTIDWPQDVCHPVQPPRAR